MYFKVFDMCVSLIATVIKKIIKQYISPVSVKFTIEDLNLPMSQPHNYQ